MHRDIKPANLLLTPRGDLKILDFGIAKIADEEGLTLTGGSLGTPAYMSPEQARGATTDQRTDLWSVGIVLFEMLAGERPFEGAPAGKAAEHSRAMALLKRTRPPSPRWLERVVAKLLTSDPDKRYASASSLLADLEGHVAPPRRPTALLLAGLSAVLVTVIIGLWFQGSRASSPHYVATAQVSTDSPAGSEGELTAQAVRAGLVQGLTGLRGLATLTGDGVDLASDSPIELARALAADEVVASQVNCHKVSCQVELKRLLGKDGRVLWLESFSVPIDDLSLVVSAVAARTRQGFDSYRPIRSASRSDFGADEWREFLELRRAFETKEALSDEVLLDRLEALRVSAPSFLEVYLLEAEVLRQRFHFSRDEMALERGFELLRRAQDIAPGDPRPLILTFDLGNLGGRWDQSEVALEALELSDAGSSHAIKRRAQLLAHQGEHQKALELLRQASRLHPSAEILTSLAFAEYRTGEVEAAMQTLASVLDRTPDNFRVLSFLAQLKLAAGNVQQSVELFERLVARSRGVTELSNLGLANTLLGEADRAVTLYQEAHDLEPANPVATLNLADGLKLQGRDEEANALYERVVELLALESGEPNWQELTVEAQALAHLGREREAVTRAQRALSLERDNPQVAFEAALVYTLVGDHTSAIVNVQRALDLGLGRHWFDLPWFDRIRVDGDFVRLVERES